MNARDGALLAAACLAVFLALALDSSASNGLKPNAYGTRQMGRGGADIAWGGSATSMNANPASLATIPDEQIELCPIVFNVHATYSDPENPSVQSTGKSKFGFTAAQFPYANFGFVFDFARTEEEILEELHEKDPFHKLYDQYKNKPQDPEPIDPIMGQGKILELEVRVVPGRFPRSIAVVGRGPNCWINGASAVANYYTGSPDRAFSHVIGSSGRRVALGPSTTVAAAFEEISNPLTDPPDEIVVYYTLDVEFRGASDSAEVRVLVDGKDQGGRVTTTADVQPDPTPPRLEEKRPRFEHELWRPEKGRTPLKFGIGSFVQAGAGTDYRLSTELYPEGTQYFADFSFIGLTPTVAFSIGDWLSLGATLQINYATMSITTPVTSGAEIMQGPMFPAGSLDQFLGGFFGIPAQFGPAMKYTIDTSSTHDPGKSITHTNRHNLPDPEAFKLGEVTGTAEVKDTVSVGFGAKFGALFQITDRLTIGVTYQTKTAMPNYKGKAHIDYNRQIETFQQNLTVGHSDEVNAALPFVGTMEAELRFTFDETWSQGIVHVFADLDNNPATPLTEVPLLSPMQLPGNDPSNPGIRGMLPNGGANGFASDYDIEIVDWQLPAEIGIGVSYLFFDWLKVSVDYKRIFWKDAMESFKTVLTHGQNPDVNALMGGDSVTYELPQNWSDQNVIAVGAEFYLFGWLTLRAGWNYGNNPIPENTVMPIVPATVEHHSSLGASVKVGSFSFDAAWMHAFENTVSINESLQSRDLVGGQFSVSQDFFSLGASYDF